MSTLPERLQRFVTLLCHVTNPKEESQIATSAGPHSHTCGGLSALMKRLDDVSSGMRWFLGRDPSLVGC